MRRIRRNAFALGKKEEVSPEPPQLEQVFGVAPSDDSEVFNHTDDELEDKSCPSLTQEQVTGNIAKTELSCTVSLTPNTG